MKPQIHHGGMWHAESPPHGGVWIETRHGLCNRLCRYCHPLTGGCGLKRVMGAMSYQLLCHPLTGGCGLKHLDRLGHRPPRSVTPSRGGVD